MKIGKKYSVLGAILDHILNFKFRNACHLLNMHRKHGIDYIKNGIMVPRRPTREECEKAWKRQKEIGMDKCPFHRYQGVMPDSFGLGNPYLPDPKDCICKSKK